MAHVHFGNAIQKAALCGVTGTCFLGGFSRFTHGEFTPGFYKYQLDRAPDDESTRLVPFVDITLGTMLLFPETRALAAALCTVFQGIGVGMRIKDGKSPVTDMALASLAAYVAWCSI